MAFLPTGLVKATGSRFTILSIDHPVGFFFEAMYQTGPFWIFIGLAQIAAALLLLVPATATLGAVLFFPICLSIFLITWGVGFAGTVYVTAGMLLASVYLLCWDADRIWSAGAHLLPARERRSLLAGAHWVEWAGWTLGGTAGMALFLSTRGFVPASMRDGLFILGLAAFAAVIVGVVIGYKRSRRQTKPAANQKAPAEGEERGVPTIPWSALRSPS